MRRFGSFVSWRAITQWTICPGMMSFSPSLRLISLQRGGKMELTVTRFAFSIPASRSASSNDDRRSLCTPTPFVKKIAFGTNISCITGKPLSPTGTGGLSFLGIAFFRVCGTRSRADQTLRETTARPSKALGRASSTKSHTLGYFFGRAGSPRARLCGLGAAAFLAGFAAAAFLGAAVFFAAFAPGAGFGA